MATGVVSTEVRPRTWRLRLPDGLPDLKGKWLTLYTIIWAIMLPLAIIGPVHGLALRHSWSKRAGWGGVGITTVRNGEVMSVQSVFGADAVKAGIRPGDRIMAIDRWPIPKQTSDETFTHLERPGATTVLTLRSPDGLQRNVRVPKSKAIADERYRGTGVNASEDEAANLVSGALIPAALIPAAIMLFLRRRRQAVPALLSLGLLLITATNFAADWTYLGVPQSVLLTATEIGWPPLFAALLVFPSGRFQPRWTAVAIAALPLSPIFGTLVSDNIAVVLIGVFALLSAVALLSRYRQIGPGAERQQLRWAFFGFAIGILLLTILIPPYVSIGWLAARDPRWVVWLFAVIFPIGSLALPFMALGLMVSILRYRLYDADAVIGRSAAYGILTVGFVGLFAGSEKLAELIGEKYFEHSIGIAAGAIGAAVAAVCIVPLHNRVHRWAERRFQKPLIRLREGLPECVADLRDTASVPEIADAVMRRVENGARSTREAILLREGDGLLFAGARHVTEAEIAQWQSGWRAPDGEHVLDCDRGDLLFPLRVRLCIESADEPQTIGWLLLGPRPDGSFFGKDEREVLETIAGPIARAIHIAQVRERREEQAERRIGALEMLIEKVASAIGGGPTAAPA